MFAQAFSSAVWGIGAKLVSVEVDVSLGLPSFCIVGLPDTAVKESRDRVIAAFKNEELELPPRRVTVNLAPADLRKEGPAYDLPIALVLLAATGQLEPDTLAGHLIFGELSLDGRLCPVRGALALASAARAAGLRRVVLPRANAGEAAVLQDLEVLPADTLLQAADYFRGRCVLTPQHADLPRLFAAPRPETVDFAEVRGQAHAKRALEVAAAGGHNLLLIGPPGSGKSMLSRRLPTIQPDLSLEEALEITRIYSVSGLLPSETALVTQRPFRSPHHTVSDVALIGGGTYPRPGEVSLAHHGVLFLDELPEFSKNALEVMRQPLEDGAVQIARAAASIRYPARFMLVAAMNPCPCGYFSDPTRECTCTPGQMQKYLHKISGPLLDRIDLQVEVPAVPYAELSGGGDPEPSRVIRARVHNARLRQRERFAGLSDVFVNAHMGPKLLREHGRLDAEGQRLLRAAIERLGLSARAYHRILKVARTLADLADVASIRPEHLSEAIHYRTLDRRFWGRAGG